MRPCRLSDDNAGEQETEVCTLLYAPQGKYSVTAHGYQYTPQDLEDGEAQKYELW